MIEKTEESGSYHGPFSTYIECHAFLIGLYEGFKDFVDWDGIDKKAKNKDVENEIHYAKGGYIIGAILRILVLMIVVYHLSP